MSECVNHPDHYKTGNYECIEVMKEIFGKDAVKEFCKMNAFKYLWRSDRKNGDEDLKKAKWYLDTYLLLEILNPYEEQVESDESDEGEEESDVLPGIAKMFKTAFKQVKDIMTEIEDPDTELHKRFEIFKKVKDYGSSDELAFYHAFRDEVDDEQ